MLKLKYFEEFKSGNPFVVFTGDLEGFRKAQYFFENKKGAYLNDPLLIDFSDIGVLQNQQLWLNENECIKLVELLEPLVATNQSAHAYLDTEALGNEIEILISYGEYKDL